MYATGAQANNNPVVFFDIAADNEPLGRVTFEVSERSYELYYEEDSAYEYQWRSSSPFVWLAERTLHARQSANKRRAYEY